MTTSVFDVSKYILNKQGSMTTMKLQKLAYYSYAWHLVWSGSPLFGEKFQAWKNGPVCYELFTVHKRMFIISSDDLSMGNSEKLTETEISTVDAILADYGRLSSGQLSDLSHSEAPWFKTRHDPILGEVESGIISDELMKDFYTEAAASGINVTEIAWPRS